VSLAGSNSCTLSHLCQSKQAQSTKAGTSQRSGIESFGMPLGVFGEYNHNPELEEFWKWRNRNRPMRFDSDA
jgi:hypothetical protein